MTRTALTAAAMLCAISLVLAQSPTAVRVWAGSLPLPTYIEGPANPNPPFDFFSYGRFNYPYPIRDALTDRRETVSWRTLNLENEYLRLTVLPDLGGHIYSCLDKRNNREMFYANSSIKKALIGYRGAWAALGVEFNFPVSHNWMSMSPVDFATAQNADGSGSIWVGNVDQVYGGQWRVELRLRPGRSGLEQHVDLYNPSQARFRYYWWNNGAVQVWDDSHLVYPTELMATHGFTRIEPWPIDEKGRDLSVIRNQADGPVSLFTYHTREGFVGVYHPHTHSGTVHVADPSELPTHKVWSWGHDRDAADWRTALSDDDSAYVELQAGLFRNQETYAFLEPQETVNFSEYWLPVRDLGGITRANVDAVLHMERPTPSHVQISLDVTRDLSDAHIQIFAGSAMIDRRVSLSPRETWRWEGDVAEQPVRFTLSDANDRPVIAHTENRFDREAATGAPIGPQPLPRVPRRTLDVDDIVERGRIDELEGRRHIAMSRYQAAVGSHPDSLSLLKAAGLLAVSLGWADSQSAASTQTLEWLERAIARNTTDEEVQYYLGSALASAGRFAEARRYLESARRFKTTRVSAGVELARLLARQNQAIAALDQLRPLTDESPRAMLPRGLVVSLLRRDGRMDDARSAASKAFGDDPTSSFIRYELTKLGQPDDRLWEHLAADANRVLDLVDQYMSIGAWDDAADLLTRQYPAVEMPQREPGAVPPDQSPLVAYYRAYVHERAGQDPVADLQVAHSLPLTYVFPSRRSSYAVLNAALKHNSNDTTAQVLLGSLYLSSGLVEPAIAAWQHVRQANPKIPVLHRNLGLALLQQSNYTEARSVLQEGVLADSENVDVYLALDAALSALGASARDRAVALMTYPLPDAAKPAALIFKAAIALAESGDAQGAERLFHDRFFPSEEGGTNVRTVYAQVRLTSARLAAARGHCDAAQQIVDSMFTQQAGLPFTAGGLTDTIAAPSLALQIASVELACGKSGAARARLERLERPLGFDGSPMTLVIADMARSMLGRARTAVERARLEHAVEDATATLESAGTSSPGLLEYARGALLQQLGKDADARRSLQRVFSYPDRGLSHALARAALKPSAPVPPQRSGL